jgi:hypothetical protein
MSERELELLMMRNANDSFMGHVLRLEREAQRAKEAYEQARRLADFYEWQLTEKVNAFLRTISVDEVA